MFYYYLVPTFLQILSIFLKPSLNFYLKFMHFSIKKILSLSNLKMLST